MARGREDQFTGRLWTESGEDQFGMVAEVAPLVPVQKSYSFAVPSDLEDQIGIGHRVVVSIGRRAREVMGFVIGLDRRAWDSTLRPIRSIVDSASYLTPHLIDLGKAISAHYACPLGQTLKAITPEAVRRQSGLKRVRYAELAVTRDEIEESGRKISPKRQRIIDLLDESPVEIAVASLLETAQAGSSVLRELVKLGWVRIVERMEVGAGVDFDLPRDDPEFSLNDEQEHALTRIKASIAEARFAVTLLFGVSGSGKTEVYVKAMQHVLDRGGQAILLVPEIVLTTQLVTRLASRFENVAVNHSGLTDGQRSVVWRQIASGEKRVVIGTRSAVFAPCPNLGIICVDEEQEGSYKNLQSPRFHVRDVAILRGRLLDIPVVLGSATPSLESWYNSEHKSTYARVELTKRVKNLPMPDVRVVDMKREWREQRRQVVLSSTALHSLKQTLDRNEQGMILINRRGFANRLVCDTCGTHLECSSCNVGLVVHVSVGQARCHYCRRSLPTPERCPNIGCGGTITPMGSGTQRVESVLEKLFPKARILRVDSDTMSRREHYQQAVDRFTAREVDLLVGTQMIAKGLDFPHVSFVGVISADVAAGSSDFRSQENLFHLMTQVAGRAGRAESHGQVVIQTTTPEVPALRYALRHDYESFAREELAARQAVWLPPYCRLARIVLAHKREEALFEAAESLASQIRAEIEQLSLSDADVLGPTSCALRRLRGRYRCDLLIRTRTASEQHTLLGHLNRTGALRNRAESLMLDVDPVDLA